MPAQAIARSRPQWIASLAAIGAALLQVSKDDVVVEDGQVRRNAQGGTVISYGLSSYGYDLRVADEFKVFTNVYSAVVDPKAFDDRAFVDIRGDSWPPVRNGQQ